MARASTYTLLSLDRFARVLGINPVHFNGGAGGTVWPVGGSCEMLWPQHTWQTVENIVSREELALAISSAEHDIKRVIGYSPALTWEVEETHPYPDSYNPADFRRVSGVRGLAKTLKTKWGKVESGGQRAVTLVENSDATFSDPDSDGFDELVTFTGLTTVTDKRELCIFFAGHDGEPEWEIRPVRSKTITAGTYTITVDSWQLLDPDLWEAYPTTTGFEAIDITDSANYVADVDVYRVYNDTTVTQSELRWDAGYTVLYGCCLTGCQCCNEQVQAGCLNINHKQLGIVTPVPATYSDTSETWVPTALSICRAPDDVSFWYYAGETDQRWRAGTGQDPLSDYWAQTITWLATARLDKPVCGCSNVQQIAQELHRDLSRSDRNSGFTLVDQGILSNPFGTRVGEVRAWHRVMNFANEQIMEAGAF